ncbi:hypothetical protein OG440_33245 [Streptomyces sp. NBC_00637]|uniref:hypothetical protein n=1 Tax=Streptomyces sp. NBC_00637 TaxID=2903667 RepID=UPI00325543E3
MSGGDGATGAGSAHGCEYRMSDLPPSQSYDRDGGEPAAPGLFTALEARRTRVIEVG